MYEILMFFSKKMEDVINKQKKEETKSNSFTYFICIYFDSSLNILEITLKWINVYNNFILLMNMYFYSYQKFVK